MLDEVSSVVFPQATYIFKYMDRSRNDALYIQSSYGNIGIIEINHYLQPIIVRDRDSEATAIECGFTFRGCPRLSPDNRV